jgi:hypothetical protein
VYGALAQLVARFNGIEEVTGSNPVRSKFLTMIKKRSDVEPKKNSFATVAASIVLLTMGLILSFTHDISRLPTFLMAVLTPVTKAERPDFSSYDRLLKTYVKDGLIDYKKLKQGPELNQALDWLARNNPSLYNNRDDAFCYWMNAHNLLAIKIMADGYPNVQTLRLKRDFVVRDFVVGGQSMSAEQIYTDQLRPRLTGKNDKDIVPAEGMFLFCRGALGYPAITDHAVTAQTLAADAEKGAQDFVHNKANVLYEPNQDEFSISPFFQWYREVFGRGFEDPWAYALYQLDHDDTIPYSPLLQKKFMANFNWRMNDIVR